jgi:hypothetical protein
MSLQKNKGAVAHKAADWLYARLISASVLRLPQFRES